MWYRFSLIIGISLTTYGCDVPPIDNDNVYLACYLGSAENANSKKNVFEHIKINLPEKRIYFYKKQNNEYLTMCRSDDCNLSIDDNNFTLSEKYDTIGGGKGSAVTKINRKNGDYESNSTGFESINGYCERSQSQVISENKF